MNFYRFDAVTEALQEEDYSGLHEVYVKAEEDDAYGR